jgi:hypothetical protein
MSAQAMAPARRAASWVPLLAAAVALPLLVAGCSIGSGGNSASAGARPETHGDLGSLTYRAVDRLVAAVPDLALGKAVVVGSIVDVQRVDKSLAFGSLVADMARTRLVQKGVPVSEMRLRSAVLLDHKQGAIALSNDRDSVKPPPSAVAILTGTFAAGDDLIFVSLKLVDVSDARIVGAVDFAVPRRGSETLLTPAT